jgi:predicted ATPase
MGLHTGDVEVQGAHYFGAPLYRCARLTATAHGGQTVLSEAVAVLVRDALPGGAGLRDLGAHRLKDLQRPERVAQLVHPNLPADFPPLRSLDALPHNLPRQGTPFIGREGELAAVVARLRRPEVPLLTLTGPGGTGKTRLALQAAAEVLGPAGPEGGPFPDGAWFVDLAPLTDPALVPGAVAQTLGVREAPGRLLAEALREYLRAKRLLLVLDNCEHLLPGVAAEAAALLAAGPGVRILATSREALRVAGEREHPVPPLGLPPPPGLLWAQNAAPPPDPAALSQYEAVALFVERAVAARPDFALTDATAPAVAELCHRLDGLPLAIELAAARAKVLPPAALLARLGDRLALLTGGRRDAPARQQTLRAAVAWSHDLLTPAEQILFARLAVFAGGWTLEAAEAVCARGPGSTERAAAADPNGPELVPEAVLDLLAGLADKSLVVAEEQPDGTARYRLLETLRAYARERLEARGEAAAGRRRHADHYLALAEQAAPGLRGSQQVAWLDRLEGEHANLRLALAWLAERAERGEQQAAEAALRLGAALTEFWVIRCHVAQAWEWLGRLLALPSAARTAARARALAGAAGIAYWRRDRPAARRLAAEGLALAQAVGDVEGSAVGHLWLGILARDTQDAATARPHLEASRHAFDVLDYPSRAAGAVLALADVACGAGDDQGAARLYAEAEALARPTGDAFALGHILENQEALARRVGDHRRARRLLEETLALRRAHRDPRGIGNTLAGLGRLALAEGDAPTARARLTEALTVQRDAGYVWGVPPRLRELAQVAEAQGHPARAARLWGAAAAQHQALVGRPLPPAQGVTHAQAAASLRARLGAAFAAAWAAGQAMSLEQAIADALDDAPDSPGHPT